MITPEQLYDNFEFKLLQKELKKEFPWIVKLYTWEGWLNDFPDHFWVGIYFNPYELAKKYNLTIDEESLRTSPEHFMRTYFEPESRSKTITWLVSEHATKILRKLHGLPSEVKINSIFPKPKELGIAAVCRPVI